MSAELKGLRRVALGLSPAKTFEPEWLVGDTNDFPNRSSEDLIDAVPAKKQQRDIGLVLRNLEELRFREEDSGKRNVSFSQVHVMEHGEIENSEPACAELSEGEGDATLVVEDGSEISGIEQLEEFTEEPLNSDQALEKELSGQVKLQLRQKLWSVIKSRDVLVSRLELQRRDHEAIQEQILQRHMEEVETIAIHHIESILEMQEEKEQVEIERRLSQEDEVEIAISEGFSPARVISSNSSRPRRSRRDHKQKEPRYKYYVPET